MTSRRRLVLVSNALWALVLTGLAAFVLHVAGVGGRGLDDFFNNELYDGVMIGAGLSIVLSGLRDRRGRATWLGLGAGRARGRGGGLWGGPRGFSLPGGPSRASTPRRCRRRPTPCTWRSTPRATWP